MQGRVLIVAGSDSGGGAGIQADIKTVTALGGYAASAVTALTVQNTLGVTDICDAPAGLVAAQMRAVLSDIGADCIKIGMLHRADIIEAVAGVLADEAKDMDIVVDPVMIAKGGAPLLEDAAMDGLARLIVPRARLLTPNLPEAEALAGKTVTEAEGLARALLALGPRAVLLKGGHADGPEVVDLLVDGGGAVQRFSSPRIDTPNTHGTGCTLASAVATGLAQGMDLTGAVRRARAYVLEAIRTAPGLGAGHGPLNHGHTVADFSG